MNLHFSWDSISRVAAVAPLWFSLFLMAMWIRGVIGTSRDRAIAREDALRYSYAKHEIATLQHEANTILRQLEGRRESGALVKLDKSGVLDVHTSRIRLRPAKGAVLELSTPDAVIPLNDQRIRTLLQDNDFVQTLLDNPEASRLLLRNPETLYTLHQLMQKVSRPA